MSQASMQTAKSVRHMVIGSIQAIPEELFDTTPAGMRNTIRWNVGHLVVSLDGLLSAGMKFDSNLPESYAGLFATGTKPEDWTISPPSKEELIHYLSVQLNGISEVPVSALNESLNPPLEMGPLKFDTVGELFNFTFIHEALHLGVISSQLKFLQHT